MPLGNAARDDLRIAVKDRTAAVAHMTGPIVTGRDATRDRGSAMAAEVHGSGPCLDAATNIHLAQRTLVIELCPHPGKGDAAHGMLALPGNLRQRAQHKRL